MNRGDPNNLGRRARGLPGDPIRRATRHLVVSAASGALGGLLAANGYPLSLLLLAGLLPAAIYVVELNRIGRFSGPVRSISLDQVAWTPENSAAVDRIELLNHVLRTGTGWVIRAFGFSLLFVWSFAAPTGGVAALLPLGGLAWVLGGRLAAPSAERYLRKRAHEAPVLYLRSFAVDEANENEALKAAWWRPKAAMAAREEPALATVFSSLAPLIAVGRPGEPLPHVGASRMYLPEDAWRDSVLKLIDSAALVLIRVGDSSGVIWEIRQALERRPPDKVLLYFSSSLDDSALQTEYDGLIDSAHRLFPRPLPSIIRTNRFIRFDDQWRPTLFGAMKAVTMSSNWLLPRTFRLVLYQSKLVDRLGSALQPYFDDHGIRPLPQTLFGDLAIGIGAFFGGPMTSGPMMAWNLAAAGRRRAALATGLVSLGLAALIVAVATGSGYNEWQAGLNERRPNSAPDLWNGAHFLLAFGTFFAWRPIGGQAIRTHLSVGGQRFGIPLLLWIIVPAALLWRMFGQG